jgi:hypothetical protein
MIASVLKGIYKENGTQVAHHLRRRTNADDADADSQQRSTSDDDQSD